MQPFRGVRSAILACMALFGALFSSAHAADLVAISITPTAVYLPIYIAEAKGYFKQFGIETKLVNSALSTDALSMAVMGQTDMGCTGAGAALFNAAAKGLGFKLTMAMGVQPPPRTIAPLLIRKDLWDAGTIRSGKDLRGRTISTNAPGGSIEYKLDLILQKYGMTLADVHSVPIGLPESIIALSNGALDAAILGEPYATEALKRQIVVMQLEDSAEGIGDLGNVVVFNQRFMAERHDVAVRVTKALIRASADLQGDKAKSDENVKILSDALKLPLATVKDMAFPNFEPTLSPLPFIASLNHQAAVHLKNKRITAATAAFEPSLVDGTFVAEAIK
jgi:NitT/TauT family transport system substrate-binding protein